MNYRSFGLFLVSLTKERRNTLVNPNLESLSCHVVLHPASPCSTNLNNLDRRFITESLRTHSSPVVYSPCIIIYAYLSTQSLDFMYDVLKVRCWVRLKLTEGPRCPSSPIQMNGILLRKCPSRSLESSAGETPSRFVGVFRSGGIVKASVRVTTIFRGKEYAILLPGLRALPACLTLTPAWRRYDHVYRHKHDSLFAHIASFRC